MRPAFQVPTSLSAAVLRAQHGVESANPEVWVWWWQSPGVGLAGHPPLQQQPFNELSDSAALPSPTGLPPHSSQLH